MGKQEDDFKKVISHAKEYGYVTQSSEIYDGLSAVYDYTQNGAELKKNISSAIGILRPDPHGFRMGPVTRMAAKKNAGGDAGGEPSLHLAPARIRSIRILPGFAFRGQDTAIILVPCCRCPPAYPASVTVSR